MDQPSGPSAPRAPAAVAAAQSESAQGRAWDGEDEAGTTTRILLDPRNVTRAALSVLAVVLLALLGRFVLEDGGTVIFNILMAWFAALAMEPAVGRLAKKVPRGVATALVMLALMVAFILFVVAFGRIFVDQLAELVRSIPDLIRGGFDWVNGHFGTAYRAEDVLSSLNIGPGTIAQYASQIAGGLVGVLGSIVGSVFGLFTFGLFAFYLSADSPRLRHWVASILPPRRQEVAMRIWDVTAEKTGNYVAARIVLAAINSFFSGIAFWLIGLPYWLPLAIWTGVVAQFVPTIGTYISIVLPVVVGLLSDQPIDGVWVLAYALAYQQIENLTIEPRISAKAVDVHPAVAFASVMLGAALFGVAGALLAVPVTAMLLAVAKAYTTRYEVLPHLAEAPELPIPGEEAVGHLRDAARDAVSDAIPGHGHAHGGGE